MTLQDVELCDLCTPDSMDKVWRSCYDGLDM